MIDSYGNDSTSGLQDRNAAKMLRITIRDKIIKQGTVAAFGFKRSHYCGQQRDTIEEFIVSSSLCCWSPRSWSRGDVGIGLVF